MTKRTAANDVPELIYGLVWESSWAQDGCANRAEIVYASEDRSDPRFEKEGDHTGGHISNEGYFRVREFRRPKSITTLALRDHAIFNVCANGYELGCWIQDKPHRLKNGAWTWNREEYDYIEALVVARSGQSMVEMIRGY